jgi:hypothetical protein
MPLPSASVLLLTIAPNLRCELGSETVPPIAHRFVTDVDAAFVKWVFHVPKGESGYRTYIITAKRMTAGDVLK